MKNIIETLKQLGFEEKETEVYLAAIEKVPCSILDLAKKTKIKRTSIYNFLDHMINNGLIEKVIVGKRTLYAASRPEDLTKVLEKKIEMLSEIIPDLSLLYGKSDSVKPRIRFHEGAEGLKNIYNDTITKEMEGGEYLFYSSFEEEYKAFAPYFWKVYINKRVERKVKVRGIMSEDIYSVAHTQEDKKELRESIVVSAKELEIPSTMLIYGNKVALLSLGNEKVGMIIESERIAKTQRSIFNLLWKNLKEIERLRKKNK